MRKTIRFFPVFIALFFLGVNIVRAQEFQSPAADDVTSGAQLYDKWYAALGKSAPEGNMPLWSSQTANTRSGAETWRCAECHGWDYKGKDGAYSAGSHYTGFPGVIDTAADVAAVLKGATDPGHDFSAYLDDASLNQLAAFIKNGLIDDSQYIDTVTLKTKGGDANHGQNLYETTCAKCHGMDGKLIIFRTEGINESLGAVASRDPYRFLHRTRFGVAGTEMPIGRELGWTPKDGVDVLAYVQTLPTGGEQEQPSNVGEGSGASPQVGGPPPGVAGGILTGLLAFLGTFGVSAFFLFGLVVLGFLVVWVLRKRK
jgi:thiosulfate dehydrogenase